MTPLLQTTTELLQIMVALIKNYAKKMLQTTPKIYLIKLRLLKFPRLINDYYKLR